MPYRIDISSPAREGFDRLVDLGALDIEAHDGGVAAIIPDHVTPAEIADALHVHDVTVSPAAARDNGSVWLLAPRAVHAGPHVVQLIDSTAFGTGHHPTTALCIESIEQILTSGIPSRLLDVGTGSGVLAIAGLKMGISRALGIDIDAEALKIAAQNAHLNSVADRFEVAMGGPDAVADVWPLVVANILAGPLIEMAPILVRRVASHGRLILSGIPASLESEILRVYCNLGMRRVESRIRSGWAVLVVTPSW